jgi:WXG100 family type VII secretion target
LNEVEVMAKSKSISSGQVTHLDTINFNGTILAFNGYIKRYESIVNSVDRITGQVLSQWDGVGSNAFEKDCKQVQINLKDIADVMYDLRDALTNAHAEYMKTDNSLSKSFES